MRPHRTTVAAAIILATAIALAGTATAQDTPPSPDTNDLGISENDVREEPSHIRDENGFEEEFDSNGWNPIDALVLDAYVTRGNLGEDLSNVVNVVQHGNNYGDYERTMYPGSNFFGAWWGWWSDTGGGGDLQTDETTSQAPFVGPPNGAIDDADDCEDSTWDEFTFRGPHPCPDLIQHPEYPTDYMLGFVQPGSHWNLNQALLFDGPVSLLNSEADEDQQPDFPYIPLGQDWVVESNRARYTYDASMLISTSVVTAVNPRPVGGIGIQQYDPYTAATDGDGDPLDHAVDVDVYTTPHPLVEQAYRTAVWDPDTGPHPDRGDNPDLLHDDGPKGLLKDEGVEVATGPVDPFLESTEAQRGLVNDLVQDPFFHEPNTADDEYNDWATYDPETSYGGLEGDYYEPGPNQAYPGYQAGERFWFDAQVHIQSLPYQIPPGAIGWRGEEFTPEVPSPSDPVGSAASEDEANQGPGVLFMDAWAGTWYDGAPEGDADTWVGDAPSDPYENGNVQDPNQYEEQESLTMPEGPSGPEWRGACRADVEATLYPTSDTDGDGTMDWGAAGVYVMGSFFDGNPYSNVLMDAVGPAADPVLDPLRESPIGGDVSYVFPEDDEQLSRYRTEGPIEVTEWYCPGISEDVGNHAAVYNIILPTGTLDFTFKSVVRGELTDPARKSLYGLNQGASLTGQTIVDVDHYGQMTHVLDDVGN